MKTLSDSQHGPCGRSIRDSDSGRGLLAATRLHSTKDVTCNLPSVAIFVPNFRIGGAERQAYELASRLGSGNYRLALIALRGEGDLLEWFRSIPNLSVIALDSRDPLSTLIRLNSLIAEREVRVIHSFLDATHFYSLITRAIRWRLKVILSIRDAHRDRALGYATWRSRTRERILGIFLKHARFLATIQIPNSETGRRMIGGNRASRFQVIPNGIDCERFKPDPSLRDWVRNLIKVPLETPLVGIVANCTVYKDYPTFIRAAEIVSRKFNDVHFLSIGENRTKVGGLAKSLVRELGVNDRFHFLGTRSDVERLLPGLDLLCSSSVTEAFSNSICEGMSCGVPCVATDVGDSRMIVGDTGVVVPPGHPEELAAAIMRILKLDTSEARKLGMRARQRILENYEVSRMVAQYERIYESLLQLPETLIESVHTPQ